MKQIRLKGVIHEDYVNYKEPSMVLLFPHCSFKCDNENGTQLCHGRGLSLEKDINVEIDSLIDKYLENDLTHAIVCSGLDPMDSFAQLKEFIRRLRLKTDDMVIIYTGYKNDEIELEVDELKEYPNIIVKFGRFKPGYDSHKDPVLGVDLASPNQYAVKIS